MDKRPDYWALQGERKPLHDHQTHQTLMGSAAWLKFFFLRFPTELFFSFFKDADIERLSILPLSAADCPIYTKGKIIAVFIKMGGDKVQMYSLI